MQTSYPVEKGEITAGKDLIGSVIVEQASDLEHGWREATQNGLDSDGDTVRIFWDSKRTIVMDNGSGVELTTEEGEKLLTELANTSKDRDDDSTIGQFGIGKGQIVAKGCTVFISDGVALFFNVKEWGIDIERVDSENAVAHAENIANNSEILDNFGEIVQEAFNKSDKDTGLIVAIEHYEDGTPDENSYKWDRYEDRFKDRFKYTELSMGTKVYANGECISDKSPDEEVSGTYEHHEVYQETSTVGTVHISVCHGNTGSLSVYSNGVYVTDVNTRGISGEIVTENNLSLNFARNEIKSECDIWDEIEQRLDEIRFDLFTDMPPTRLNSEARSYLVGKISDDNGRIDPTSEWEDVPIFKTTTEQYVSIEDVRSRNEVGVGKNGDDSADRLSETYNMITLDKTDSATEALVSTITQDDGLPDTFDPEDKASDLGLVSKNTILDVEELTPGQRTKLGVAREMANRIGIDRTIYYGEGTPNAWTNGLNKIVITDTATPSSKWEAWVPELFETIIHEYCHRSSTLDGCSNHGRRFNREYREELRKNSNVRASLIRDISEEGIRSFRV